MDERIKAAIDADFFRKITEYERGNAIFLKVMNELDIQPVMHEFVARDELKSNPYLQELLEANEITVAYYSDYLKAADKESYIWRKNWVIHILCLMMRMPELQPETFLRASIR